MTDISRVSAGEPMSAKWANKIVDRLNESSFGSSIGRFALPPFTAKIRNDTGGDLDFAELVHVTDYLSRYEDKPLQIATNTRYSGESVEWHNKIARVAVTAMPIPDGEFGDVILFGQCVVKAENAATAGDQVEGEYVMIDPSTPKQVATSTGGIGRIIARSGQNHINIMLGITQPLFRYRMLEASQAPETTLAKLVSLDGDDIGDIDLSDPLSIAINEGTDDEGFCEMIGNTFHVGTGPCNGS